MPPWGKAARLPAVSPRPDFHRDRTEFSKWPRRQASGTGDIRPQRTPSSNKVACLGLLPPSSPERIPAGVPPWSVRTPLAAIFRHQRISSEHGSIPPWRRSSAEAILQRNRSPQPRFACRKPADGVTLAHVASGMRMASGEAGDPDCCHNPPGGGQQWKTLELSRKPPHAAWPQISSSISRI